MDCTQQGSLCTEQGVRGYPTLMLYKGGEKEGVKYNNQRTLQALSDFVKSNL